MIMTRLKDKQTGYALMLKDFHELRKGKYYKIVDEIDDGRSVIDANTGKPTESLLAVPPEYFVPLTAEQVAVQIKKRALGGLK